LNAVTQDRIALSAHAVTKRFPGVVANDRVDFEVRAGEVHALLGENGSGKTTLCKIFTGLYRPDEGHVEIDARRQELHSPADAHAAGVFMVHQHFSLVERMTVAENVMLGWRRGSRLRFDRRAAEREVSALAEQHDLPVNPRATVADLSLGERQRIEILKALCRGARVLILDEPTTVLTPQEADGLFASLRRLAASGSAVVFISHKLHEVLAVSDRVSVLRRGVSTGTVDLRENTAVDRRELARMMVGREIELGRRVRAAEAAAPGDPILELDEVTVEGEHGRPALDRISLEVGAGEVLGIAGVAGNGQRQLADVIAGLQSCDGGEIRVAGKVMRSRSPLAAIAGGVAFVPEDRFGMGLAPGMTVAENMVLKSFRRGGFSAGPFMRRRRVVANAEERLEGYDLRGDPHSVVGQLSGGNAQKVLLARELGDEPKVLVIAAPTRGLDVSATETVRRLIARAAAAGTAVVMISEDLDEVLDVSDRVAVMCGGRVTGVLAADSADIEEIGLLMMGQATDDGHDGGGDGSRAELVA
jgi:simple sugar transport system ATP-binding protein